MNVFKPFIIISQSLAVFFLFAFEANSQMFFIPAEYETLNHPAPSMEFINPYFTYKGDKINTIQYTIDDWGIEGKCSIKDRGSDPKKCGKPITISPGAHMMSLLLCTQSDCNNAFGKVFTLEFQFTVGLREKLVFDVTKAALLPEGVPVESILIRSQQSSGKKPSPCIAAIEQAFYINTCNSKGMAQFEQKVIAMDKACRPSWTRDSAMLIQLAFWQVSYLQPERCYTSKERKKIPRALISWHVDDNFWPQGTLKNETSWTWARNDDESERLFSKYKDVEFREKAFAQIRTWIERQKVVDQLIAVALDPKKNLDALLRDVAAHPKDMDPRTIDGHRNFMLSKLVEMVSGVGSDPRVTKLQAQTANANTSLHCNMNPEAKTLINGFVMDNNLDANEWKALKGLVDRTPNDESIDECGIILRDRIKGISILERARYIAKKDCAKNRPEDLRGKVISSALRPDLTSIPKPDRILIMKEFSDCISF